MSLASTTTWQKHYVEECDVNLKFKNMNWRFLQIFVHKILSCKFEEV